MSTASASSASVSTDERPLRADERALLEHLCAVLPSGQDLLDGLDEAQVRETSGFVGSVPARSVVRVEHWGRPEVTALPVRGFPVDECGRAIGEVVVWIADGRLVGYQLCAAAGCPVPGHLDPDMLDAVPWT